MIKTTVVLPQKGIFFTVFVFLMIAILIELIFKKVQENCFSHTSSLSHYEKIKKTELPKLLSVHGIIISESRHRIACRKKFEYLIQRYSPLSWSMSTENIIALQVAEDLNMIRYGKRLQNLIKL